METTSTEFSIGYLILIYSTKSRLASDRFHSRAGRAIPKENINNRCSTHEELSELCNFIFTNKSRRTNTRTSHVACGEQCDYTCVAQHCRASNGISLVILFSAERKLRRELLSFAVKYLNQSEISWTFNRGFSYKTGEKIAKHCACNIDRAALSTDPMLRLRKRNIATERDDNSEASPSRSTNGKILFFNISSFCGAAACYAFLVWNARLA